MRHLFLYSIIRASFNTASAPLQLKQTATDVITSGLYSVQGCGTNASQILSIISPIRTYLQPAITDTTHTPTSLAYNAFFKNINHAPFVRKIFQNIASGTPILPGLPQPRFSRVSSPVIACMPDPPLTNPPSDLVGLRPWAQVFARRDCATKRGGDNNNNNNNNKTFGLFDGGTNIVVLCPAWHTYALSIPPEPKSPKPCISVDKTRNEFRGRGGVCASAESAVVADTRVGALYVVAATDRKRKVKVGVEGGVCMLLMIVFALRAGEQRYMARN